MPIYVSGSRCLPSIPITDVNTGKMCNWRLADANGVNNVFLLPYNKVNCTSCYLLLIRAVQTRGHSSCFCFFPIKPHNPQKDEIIICTIIFDEGHVQLLLFFPDFEAHCHVKLYVM